MRRKLVAGNWKVHGSLPENAALLDAVSRGAENLDAVQVAVCVPFPYLAQAQSVLHRSRVVWGAQNVSSFAKGAYTGEVSGSMLGDFGCRYVIVGHSERRALFGEDRGIVARKFKVALEYGLEPILCVGETLEQRETGVTERVVAEQLDAVTAIVGPVGIGKGVIAYEPVWAIGTGRNATPEQAQAMHEFIRRRVAEVNRKTAASLQIVYGGSVKASNACDLFSMPDIDGGLVGGASLVAEEFTQICVAAQVAARAETANA